MKKIKYLLGTIFISISLLFVFSCKAPVQEKKADVIQSGQIEPELVVSERMVFEETSAQALEGLNCEERFGFKSNEIERWWVFEGDNTIKTWDEEAKICNKLEEENAQDNCKALANQKYYNIIKSLAKRKELKAQKVQETYDECLAKEGLIGTEEEIKK